MAEVTVIKGEVRVVMDDYCGEGIEGDYNPDDPKDIPLMRFAVERKYNGAWEFCEDTSYCTQIDSRLPKAEHARLANLILNKVYKAAMSIKGDPQRDRSCKRLAEEMSWINPTWGTKNKKEGWVLGG